MNLDPISPYALLNTLKFLLQIPPEEATPSMLWGAPGLGKSKIVADAAAANNLVVTDLRLSSLEPTDLMGLPYRDSNSKLQFAKLGMLPNPEDPPGVLFLDEINNASPSVSAVAYQLVLDRKINDYSLPSHWHVVAAGNRPQDRGLAKTMPAPLQNRFQHYFLQPNIRDTARYFAEHQLSSDVSGFLNFSPDSLFRPSPDDVAWPSPRTWEKLARLLPHLKANPNCTIEFQKYTYQAIVGISAATEFLGFQRMKEHLPSIQTIINRPGTAIVPTEAAPLYATAVMLITAADKDTFAPIVTYAERLPMEIQMYLFYDLNQRKPALTNHKAYQAWAVKHASGVQNL